MEIIEGNRPGEPPKPFSCRSAGPLMCKPLDKCNIESGTIQAGFFFTSITGYWDYVGGGLAFFIQNVSYDHWTMFAVYLDMTHQKLQLIRWLDGVETLVSEMPCTIPLNQLMWLGVDFSQYTENEAGLIKIHATPIEGGIIRADTLKMTIYNPGFTPGGSVGLYRCAVESRTVDLTAGSPAHAEFADEARALRGPIIAGDQRRVRYNEDENRFEWSDDGTNWTAVTGGTEGGTGDMLKTTYDQDEDGVVDAAESAPWSGITGKPVTFAPSAHAASHEEGSTDALAGQNLKVIIPAHPNYYLEPPPMGRDYKLSDHLWGIDQALGGKADTIHSHDDRYYTESEIDAIVAGLDPAEGGEGTVLASTTDTVPDHLLPKLAAGSDITISEVTQGPGYKQVQVAAGVALMRRTSANRPGVTKLYRRDDDSNYNLQTYFDGTRWVLQSYQGENTLHATVRVGYADTANYATSAGTATSAATANAVNRGLMVQLNSNQSLSRNAWNTISWHANIADTGGTATWSAGNPAYIYITQTGWHIVDLGVRVDASAGRSITVGTQINGAWLYGSWQTAGPHGGGTTHTARSCMPIWLSAGNYVSGHAYWYDPNNNAPALATWTRMSVTRI